MKYPDKMLAYGYDSFLNEVNYNYVRDDVTNDELFEDFYFDRFKCKYYFCRPSYDEYQKYLYESLLYSYDISLLENKLYEKCESIRRIYNHQEFLIAYAYDESEKDIIENIAKFYGYFIASCDYDKNNFVYIMESVYGVSDVTDYVYNECNGIIYHITHEKRVYKILQQGLCTKSQNKRAVHPPRIYFTINPDKEKLKELAKDLYPDGDYAVLKVNVSKNDTHKCKFFIDAAYDEYGIWTSDMIAPKCIEIFEI